MKKPLFAGIVALGGVFVALPVPHAAAAAPTQKGWWVKAGAAVPTVPAGGLFVGDDPSAGAGSTVTGTGVAPASPGDAAGPEAVGPTGYSALRLVGVSPNSDVLLTLRVATGSQAPPAALTSLVACPLLAPLVMPASGGDVATAPGYSCASASDGKVAGDGNSVSWDLPPTFQRVPGELDIAVAPDPTGPPVAYAVAFDAPDGDTFEQPGASRLGQAPAPAAPVASPATAAARPAPGGSGGVGRAPAPRSPRPTGATSSAIAAPGPSATIGPPAGALPPAVAPPSPAVTGGAIPEPGGLAAGPAPAIVGGPAVTPVVRATPASGLGRYLPIDSRRQRVVALAALLLLLLGLSFATRTPARQPVLLGGARRR